MKKMWKEFKEFAFRGNVLDLAVGVVIGTAFTAIVNSLVKNIIMPLIALIPGVINFSEMEAGGVPYGLFIQSVVDFFLIAFSVFIFVKLFNKVEKGFQKIKDGIDKDAKAEEAAPAGPPKPSQEELLTEIRDLLKNNLDEH